MALYNIDDVKKADSTKILEILGNIASELINDGVSYFDNFTIYKTYDIFEKRHLYVAEYDMSRIYIRVTSPHVDSLIRKVVGIFD